MWHGPAVSAKLKVDGKFCRFEWSNLHGRMADGHAALVFALIFSGTQVAVASAVVLDPGTALLFLSATELRVS